MLEATNTRTTFQKQLFEYFNKVPHFQSYNHKNAKFLLLLFRDCDYTKKIIFESQ